MSFGSFLGGVVWLGFSGFEMVVAGGVHGLCLCFVKVHRISIRPATTNTDRTHAHSLSARLSQRHQGMAAHA